MRNMKKRSIALLIAIAALLIVAVSGTVAYLVTSAGPVKNEFKPAEVTTEIDEGFDGETKSKIVIKNTGDIPVYVRVAVTGAWWKDEKIVDNWTPSFTIGTDWIQGSDGYYYYTKPVPVEGETSDLLGSDIKASTNDGKVLHVDVLSQSIQAKPTDAVTEKWKVTVDENGKITGSSN